MEFNWAWGMHFGAHDSLSCLRVVLIVKALVLKCIRKETRAIWSISSSRSRDRALRGGAAWSRSNARALLYIRVGAMADLSASMLYSLSAITSYAIRMFSWRNVGAARSHRGDEPADLFGLTTAFLFAAIEGSRPLDSASSSPRHAARKMEPR